MENDNNSNLIPVDFKDGIDVICDRGEQAKRSNEHYRALIRLFYPAYAASTTTALKRMMAEEILKIIKTRGGRFLKGGVEQSHDESKKKIMKALKDFKRQDPTRGSTSGTNGLVEMPEPPSLSQIHAHATAVTALPQRVLLSDLAKLRKEKAALEAEIENRKYQLGNAVWHMTQAKEDLKLQMKPGGTPQNSSASATGGQQQQQQPAQPATKQPGNALQFAPSEMATLQQISGTATTTTTTNEAYLAAPSAKPFRRTLPMAGRRLDGRAAAPDNASDDSDRDASSRTGQQATTAVIATLNSSSKRGEGTGAGMAGVLENTAGENLSMADVKPAAIAMLAPPPASGIKQADNSKKLNVNRPKLKGPKVKRKRVLPLSKLPLSSRKNPPQSTVEGAGLEEEAAAVALQQVAGGGVKRTASDAGNLAKRRMLAPPAVAVVTTEQQPVGASPPQVEDHQRRQRTLLVAAQALADPDQQQRFSSIGTFATDDRAFANGTVPPDVRISSVDESIATEVLASLGSTPVAESALALLPNERETLENIQ